MTREKASSLRVGRISGPHGVKGEVKLISYLAGNLELRGAVEVVLFFPDGSKQVGKILSVREGPKGLLLTIEGVSDRNQAETLRDVDVEVDADLLPEPEEDEYYWNEMIGLEVFDKGERFLGRVGGFIERAGQDLLILDMDGREVLVPFVEPIIVSVDTEAERITIDPPEGLLELAD